MNPFSRGDKFERELRAARPRPSDGLVHSIEARIESARRPLARRGSFRFAVPVALTAAMVGGLTAVGGISYAASSVTHAAKAVSHAFVPAKNGGVHVSLGRSAGGDQYLPGFGYGDPNHNHDGPPGLDKAGGAFAPPLQAKKHGKTQTVSTRFTIDEQAHLFVSVVDTKTDEKIPVIQNQSKIGAGIKGVPAKTINYLVLVPRTIPITLTVGSQQLVSGRRYVIQIIARDPNGNKKTLKIPFIAA
jgi:hypothetical protein